MDIIRKPTNRANTLKLASFSVCLLDFGSGFNKGFLRICLMIISAIVYGGSEMIHFIADIVENRFFSTIRFYADVPMHFVLWYSINSRGKQMRRLLRNIASAERRINALPNGSNGQGIYFFIFLLVSLPILYPITNFSMMYGNGKLIYAVEFFFKNYSLDHPLALAAVAFTCSFLMDLTNIFFPNAFCIYYVIVCHESKRLLNRLRVQLRDQRLDLNALFDAHKIVCNNLDEADNLLNYPITMITLKIFVFIFFTLNVIFGVDNVCDDRVACSLYYLFFFCIVPTYFVMTYVAANVHREGNKFESDVRDHFGMRGLENLTRGEIYFVDTVGKREFAYSGCQVFRFTRKFIVASIGTMMTYSLLFLQLGPQPSSPSNSTKT